MGVWENVGPQHMLISPCWQRLASGCLGKMSPKEKTASETHSCTGRQRDTPLDKSLHFYGVTFYEEATTTNRIERARVETKEKPDLKNWDLCHPVGPKPWDYIEVPLWRKGWWEEWEGHGTRVPSLAFHPGLSLLTALWPQASHVNSTPCHFIICRTGLELVSLMFLSTTNILRWLSILS